jgi:Uma2 family endonuclease
MTATVARWTIDDYHRMIEAGLLVDRRVELLDGLIIEMPPEGPEHADLSTDADEWFKAVARGRYRVRSAKPITVAETNSEPEPDIALVMLKSYRQAHPSPSEVFLIIEFSNTTVAKDTQEKRRLYARAGIEDYWVANLRDSALMVYRQPQAGDYQSVQLLQEGMIAPLAFPDIPIAVSRLL